MNVKKATFTEAEREEIRNEMAREHQPHVYKRLLALKLKAIDGYSSEEAGKIAGMYASSVNRIVNRYQTEGMQAIVGKRHNHGNRYMTYEQEVAFLEQFKEKSEAGHIVEVTEIHLAYQEAVGHPVTRNAIYYLLKKHGWRKIMPRGKHPKKADDEAIEAYKKNLSGHQNAEKVAAKAARDVPGRGWIWSHQ